jgi:uncharacterized protein (DUF983 family)
LRRTLTLLGRALLLRCPDCGHRRILDSWFRLKPHCPGCGLWLEREEGYFLGAILCNLVASELLFVAGLALVVLLSWPTPPWTALWVGSVAGMVLAPVIFYPFSKTLWLGLDLAFQRSRPEERWRPDRG